MDNATMRRLVIKETPEPKEEHVRFDIFFFVSLSELVCGLCLDRLIPEFVGFEICFTAFFITLVVFAILFMSKRMAYISKLKAFRKDVKKIFFEINGRNDFLEEVIRLAEIDEDDLEFTLQPTVYHGDGIFEDSLYCKAELVYCGHSVASEERFRCSYHNRVRIRIILDPNSRILFSKKIMNNLEEILEIKKEKK